MPVFPLRPSLRRRVLGVTPLTIFLVATLGLAAWLGYQAVDAAASHRRTAEAVLRDYAEISATEFASAARRGLDDVLDEAFEPVIRRIRTRGPPSSAIVARGLEDAARDQGCPCPLLRSPLLVFRLDPSGDGTISLEATPDTLSPETRRRIADLIDLERPGAGRARSRLVTVQAGELLAEPTAVGYVLSNDEDGEAEPTFGFVISSAALQEIFQEWYDERRLLPQPIAGDEPNDSLLYVAVESPGGDEVFVSRNPYPMTLASSASIGSEFGDLVVHAAVRPDAANRLIIGGLPNTRLPFLAVLLIMTLGVGVAGFVQLRREQGFQRLREDFVSGVSHELRTPLAQIRMFSELQEAGKLGSTEDQRRAVSVIARESRRLSHLVDNILQFSSLERRGQHAMPRDRLDLAEAVSEGVDSVTPLLQDRGMKLEVDAEPGLRVLVNRDALTRVVVNLLDNAVKYGPTGQTVRVGVDRVNGAARLSVSDQGPGVPPSEREKIWKAYRRLDRDVKARTPGSGIGLSVVADLAALHGGKVWVTDAEGGGARFVVELPLSPETTGGSEPPPGLRDDRMPSTTEVP